MCFYVKEEMNEEKIRSNVDAALNVETFNVLEYLEDQPVATDEVTIYTNVSKARALHKLMEERAGILAERNRAIENDDYGDLSIADAAEDTDLDDEINGVIAELERTALTFSMKTVAPALIRAIEKSAEAKAQSDWTIKEQEAHRQKTTADILSRAIHSVTRGDGAVDQSDWDAQRLIKLEEALYTEQAQRLISALYDMVYTGQVFEEALTVDFS